MITPDKTDMKEREIVPVGNHVARLYSIIEIGHLPDMFNEGKLVHKMRLTFELPEEVREFDGKETTMVIGGKYTVSLYEKANLRPIVEGMLGKLDEEDTANFDFRTLIGKPCMVQVVHQTSQQGKTYAKILSVTQVPKKLEVPAPFNLSQYFDYSYRSEESIYQGLPQFIKDDMAVSTEMKRKVSGSETDEEIAAGIPFKPHIH